MTRIALLTAILASPAVAQTPCLPLPQFLDGLAERFAETPRMSGLMGTQLMVLTASDAGTWTALIVEADGTACMAAAGDVFVMAPVAIPGAVN